MHEYETGMFFLLIFNIYQYLRQNKINNRLIWCENQLVKIHLFLLQKHQVDLTS